VSRDGSKELPGYSREKSIYIGIGTVVLIVIIVIVVMLIRR
jgi:hypothetical protein